VGILDMENLLTEYQNEVQIRQENNGKSVKIKYLKGPIEMNEANEFMIIYNILVTNKDKDEPPKFEMKIYKKPEMKRQMIIRDFNK